VEAIEPNRRLRLKSEMHLYGRAWLEFEVTGTGSSTTIRQTAIFDPVGLIGQIYWYSLYLPHQFVFSGMLRGIAQAALREMRDLDKATMPSNRFSGGAPGSSAEPGVRPPNGKPMARITVS
jgi:hypothetical protein